MVLSPPGIESRDGRGQFKAILIAHLATSFTFLAGSAFANIRAPEVVQQIPSTAPFPADASLGLVVLGEDLTFKCGAQVCDVEARYRIQSHAAVGVTLSFVMPLPAPLRFRVGSTDAIGHTVEAPAGALRDDDLENRLEGYRQLEHLPKYQATFVAPLAAGENMVTVAYRQPLGRRERGHSYLSKGRFTEFFRYELWPLSEWRHAPGFHLSGTVSIHRPPPSWWKRTFSQPRSLACGKESYDHTLRELQQRGDDLYLTFRMTDPLPKRLWCTIGDEDLVSN